MSSSQASIGPLGDPGRPPASFEELLKTHRHELLVHCYRALLALSDRHQRMPHRLADPLAAHHARDRGAAGPPGHGPGSADRECPLD